MIVSQIMSRSVLTCGPTENLAAAASKMWECDVGCLPVVGRGGELVGMITDRDICMAALTQGRPLDAVPVSVAMSKDVFACSQNDPLAAAEEIMRARQIRRLPVVDDDGSLVGILSINDLSREAQREAGRKSRDVLAQEVAATLAAICAPRQGGGNSAMA